MGNITLDRAHDRLFDFAVSLLERRGFTVEREKTIPHGRYVGLYGMIEGSSHFRIDVYGERDDEILMYEVGGYARAREGVREGE